MPLVPGTKLGPYEIGAPLSAGGMGEVYQARDTRLDRTVAIKILPADLSSDPVSKQRFEREAKIISSLNHPHICVLYDVGSQDCVDYLVMECVEGETMAKRLEKGALPLEQVLKYGMQIADALDKAGEPGDYQELVLSPDGTRVALMKRSGQASDLWLLDLSRDTSTRFTFGLQTGIDSHPVWSPDGMRIVFSSGNDLYQKPTSSVKDAELLLKSSAPQAMGWSRDGRFLLYRMFDPKTDWDFWVLPLEVGKKPVPFLVTAFREGDARFSPDGHWVAYFSNESGDYEVYVRSFAMNSAGTAVEAGGKWQISNGYGRQPCWRGDGRELYYSARDGQVMAVEIATNPEFRPGKPQPLGFLAGAEWDCTADGRRFLVAVPKTTGKGDRPEPYTVILNWQASLKR